MLHGVVFLGTAMILVAMVRARHGTSQAEKPVASNTVPRGFPLSNRANVGPCSVPRYQVIAFLFATDGVIRRFYFEHELTSTPEVRDASLLVERNLLDDI